LMGVAVLLRGTVLWDGVEPKGAGLCANWAGLEPNGEGLAPNWAGLAANGEVPGWKEA